MCEQGRRQDVCEGFSNIFFLADVGQFSEAVVGLQHLQVVVLFAAHYNLSKILPHACFSLFASEDGGVVFGGEAVECEPVDEVSHFGGFGLSLLANLLQLFQEFDELVSVVFHLLLPDAFLHQLLQQDA